MASYSFLVLTLCLVSGLNFIETRSQSISLRITPDKCIANTVKGVQISCVVNGNGGKDKEITLIEISRNNQEPMALFRKSSGLFYGSDESCEFQADGSIGKKQSYLKLTLTNPKSEDTGIYTCVMYYVDKKGVLRNQKSSQKKLDVKSLETVLNTLKDKINDVEKKSKGQSDKNTQDVNGKVTALVKRIKGLEKHASASSAFSATNRDADIITTKDKVLVLPTVIMTQGSPGFNATTGVFTATIAGTYVFHLTFMENYGCGMHINIFVNKVLLARVYTNPRARYDQSSNSAVANLAVGDRVYPLMMDSKCTIHRYGYTIFTGYLINAF